MPVAKKVIKDLVRRYINIIKSMVRNLLENEKYVHDVERAFTCQITRIEKLVVNVAIQNLFNKFAFF